MGKTDELIQILQVMEETGEQLLCLEDIEAATHSYFIIVRCIAANVLVHYPMDFSKPLLLKLLVDKSHEVRSSAAINLKYVLGKDVVLALQHRFIYDTDPLTRGYAGYSLLKHPETSNYDICAVEERLIGERNYFVKAICFGALYERSSKSDYLKEIIQCFKSKNYRTRCAVSNILLENLTLQNVQEILNAAKIILKKEQVPAVLSNIEGLIREAESVLNKV